MLRRRREATMEERFLATGAVQPHADRREHTFARLVAAGLLRLAVYLVVALALAAGVGLLFGWWRGSDMATTVSYAYYISGVAIVIWALATGGRQVQWRGEYGEDLGPGGTTINASALLLVVAVVLLVAGAVVEARF
jgi:multisubunit Na+/H+ antiporter MnhB subunit